MPQHDDELQKLLTELEQLDKAKAELKTKTSATKKKLAAVKRELRYDRRRIIGDLVLEHLLANDALDSSHGTWLLELIDGLDDTKHFGDDWLDDERLALLEKQKRKNRRKKHDA